MERDKPETATPETENLNLTRVSFDFDSLTRLRGGLSLERDIAPAIGVSPHVLWGWESGRRAPSAPTVFVRLAFHLFKTFNDPRYLDLRYWAKWEPEVSIITETEKDEIAEEKS